MRIGLYIRSLAVARGAERVCFLLAEGLAARGHAVDVLVENDEGALIEVLRCPGSGVCVVQLHTTGLLDHLRQRVLQFSAVARLIGARPAAAVTGWRRWTWPLIEFVGGKNPPIVPLERYMTGERPDAVLSFLNYPNLALLLARQVAPASCRLAVSVHNHLSTAAGQAKSRWMRAVPDLSRMLFPAADAIVVTSKGVGDDVAAITGLPRERMRVLYNPVWRPEIEALADQVPAHPWFIDNGPPIVLGAGKLKPQKDFPTLVAAFAAVVRSTQARLVILGEGGDKAELLAQAERLGVADLIDFPGHVANPFPFYARAGVFVLSSAWEGFGNVIVEALACGCPVVSTDCPSGPREILKGGTYGALVPVGDSAVMAAAIVRTLRAPLPRETLIGHAREFSVERAVQRLEALLAPPPAVASAESAPVAGGAPPSLTILR